MPSQQEFVKNQDRKYFNIHFPTAQPYIGKFVKYNVFDNKKPDDVAVDNGTKVAAVSANAPAHNNPLPEAEANRQQGSGYTNGWKGHVDPMKHVRGRFSTMPVHERFTGTGAMANNFDVSQKAPTDKVYVHMPKRVHTSTQIQTKAPLAYGGTFNPIRSHGYK